MPDESSPPPGIVSNYERAGQLIQEARAIDGMMKTSIRSTTDLMVRRGQALAKAQQMCQRGQFDDLLKKNWPEITRRTAYRNMKLATEKAKSDMVSLIESHTHKVLDDKDSDEKFSGEKLPPLTDNERKILIFLIGTAKPSLAQKIRSGKKKMSDNALRKACPPSCDRCMRGSMMKFCPTCLALRQEAKAKPENPENPDDPTSPPKPPPDPYKQAKSSVTKTTTTLTKLAGEDGVLYEAFKACRLMDHADGKLRCRALAGVARVIEMVADGETDLKKIKAAYDVASGGFVPPMYEHKRGRS